LVPTIDLKGFRTLQHPRTHESCLPKFEVNKFDGLDPIGWVTQMEYYFSLHHITDDLIKICVGVHYLDIECSKWWQ